MELHVPQPLLTPEKGHPTSSLWKHTMSMTQQLILKLPRLSSSSSKIIFGGRRAERWEQPFYLMPSSTAFKTDLVILIADSQRKGNVCQMQLTMENAIFSSSSSNVEWGTRTLAHGPWQLLQMLFFKAGF